MNTDHSGLNKFLSLNDENFLLVQAEVCRIAQAAPHTIKERHSCMTHDFHAQERFWYSDNSQASKITEVDDSFRIAFSLKGIPVMDKFVGRDIELARLVELMIPYSTKNMHRKMCLLHGIGGVGKSQLAAEFARKHQNNFSAIFWIAGSTSEKLRRSIAAVAQRLPQHQIPDRARSLSNDTAKSFDSTTRDVL